MTFDVDVYIAWLTEQAYRPSTVDRSRREAARILRMVQVGQPLPNSAQVRAEVRRIRLYWGKDIAPQATAAFDELDRRHKAELATPLAARRAQQERAKRRPIAYPEADWGRLVEALRDSAREPLEDNLSPSAHAERCRDVALLVLTDTGLRAHDLLALTERQLATGVRTGTLRLVQKGGGERLLPVEQGTAWVRLLEFWPDGAENLAEVVSPHGDGSTFAGDAAYVGLRRRLVAWHRELELSGRPHLHRLRRTMAVRALRHTKDIELVRQLLGHRSILTTQRYVDEARVDDLRDLQRELRAK